MRIVKAYKCEYCLRSRPYASKSACEAHEERCFSNPDTHSCATCKFKGEGREQIRKGLFRTTYHCNARKPFECLTTDCPSWKLRVD